MSQCPVLSKNYGSLDIESVCNLCHTKANEEFLLSLLILRYESTNFRAAKNDWKVSAKYFAAVRQLLLDNPSPFSIWHWELVPFGQML